MLERNLTKASKTREGLAEAETVSTPTPSVADGNNVEISATAALIDDRPNEEKELQENEDLYSVKNFTV